MKNKLYLLIFILAFQSCLNMTEPEQQAEYIESYRSFNAELVDHFPKKVPNNWIHVSYGSPNHINEWYGGSTEFSLKIQITSKKKYERLKSLLEGKAKDIKNSADSCLLLVDSDENQNLPSCENYYPIPHGTIYDYDDKNEMWVKLEDCNIALIDYKSGIFIENEYLTSKETLPDKWKNGYSKGYAFNNKEQTIMYWLIIW